MLKLMTILSLTLILSSCGKLFKGDVIHSGNIRQFNTTNPEFSSYIQSFEENARTELAEPEFSIGDIPINFGDTTDDTYDGVCLIYSNGEKEIIIKKSWWDSAPETQKEIIILHELGHCRLNRDHNNELIEVDGISYKASIMNATIPSSNHYQRYEDGYHEELYQQSVIKLQSLLGFTLD